MKYTQHIRIILILTKTVALSSLYFYHWSSHWEIKRNHKAKIYFCHLVSYKSHHTTFISFKQPDLTTLKFLLSAYFTQMNSIQCEKGILSDILSSDFFLPAIFGTKSSECDCLMTVLTSEPLHLRLEIREETSGDLWLIFQVLSQSKHGTEAVQLVDLLVHNVQVAPMWCLQCDPCGSLGTSLRCWAFPVTQLLPE